MKKDEEEIHFLSVPRQVWLYSPFVPLVFRSSSPFEPQTTMLPDLSPSLLFQCPRDWFLWRGSPRVFLLSDFQLGLQQGSLWQGIRKEEYWYSYAPTSRSSPDYHGPGSDYVSPWTKFLCSGLFPSFRSFWPLVTLFSLFAQLPAVARFWVLHYPICSLTL